VIIQFLLLWTNSWIIWDNNNKEITQSLILLINSPIIWDINRDRMVKIQLLLWWTHLWTIWGTAENNKMEMINSRLLKLMMKSLKVGKKLIINMLYWTMNNGKINWHNGILLELALVLLMVMDMIIVTEIMKTENLATNWFSKLNKKRKKKKKNNKILKTFWSNQHKKMT